MLSLCSVSILWAHQHHPMLSGYVDTKICRKMTLSSLPILFTILNMPSFTQLSNYGDNNGISELRTAWVPFVCLWNSIIHNCGGKISCCSCGDQIESYSNHEELRVFSILILLINLSSSKVLILLKEQMRSCVRKATQVLRLWLGSKASSLLCRIFSNGIVSPVSNSMDFSS